MAVSFAEIGIIVREDGRAEQRIDCPRCDGRETLGVNVTRGVWHCFKCSWRGRLSEVRPREQWATTTRIDDPRVAERKRERLRATWSSTVALDSAFARSVRRYLEFRGLGAAIPAVDPHVVRAHPSLEYFEGGRVLGEWPALVALFTSPTGGGVTLHCTWIRHGGDGKAPVPTPKKLQAVPVRGATKGGAIRLIRGAAVMGIAEGIESALALHVLEGVPVWAAYCADALERVRLPSTIRDLRIGVDVDENGRGQRAAEALAARVRAWRSGPDVRLVLPSGPTPCDLNDELRARAARGAA